MLVATTHWLDFWRQRFSSLIRHQYRWVEVVPLSDAQGRLIVGPLVPEELPTLKVADRLQCGPVHLAPEYATSLVLLLDMVSSLGMDGQVLQFLL